MRLNDCDTRPWYEDTDEIKRVLNRIYGKAWSTNAADAFGIKEDKKMIDGYRAYCIADVDAALSLAKRNKPVNYAGYAKAPRVPTLKRIIISENSRVTVVLWDDGTKTIVKCSDADTYDPYTAYCAAFAKKCYGTNSQLKKTIEKFTVYQDTKMKNRPCLNESLPPDPLNFKY